MLPASSTIYFPRDLFVRLQADHNAITKQGVLFGVKESNTLHVRGFVPYTLHQELVGLLGSLLNREGMTVIGWFCAPCQDLLSQFSPEYIASCYFDTMLSAMLKVITGSYLRMHADYDVKELTSLLPKEAANLLRDLAGVVLSRSDDSLRTTVQGFFPNITATDLQDKLNQLSRDGSLDVVEEKVLGGLMEVLLGAEPTSTGAANTTDVHTDEDADVITPLQHGPPESSSPYHDHNGWLSTEAMKLAEANIARQANGQKPTTSLYPAKINILSGPASEYIAQSVHGESVMRYSTEFDERDFPSDLIAIQHDDPALRQERIQSRRKAIEEHINHIITETIPGYTEACREHQTLSACLEVIMSLSPEEWVEKLSENSAGDGERTIEENVAAEMDGEMEREQIGNYAINKDRDIEMAQAGPLASSTQTPTSPTVSSPPPASHSHPHPPSAPPLPPMPPQTGPSSVSTSPPASVPVSTSTLSSGKEVTS
ncbi:uncharacterized protein VTP21DRAFT_3274 [Calcarisporiella thermophila]|uniref:uncharacterized protein n=1 Tax=Calcarisporiella thermophila TaxID=911321 RepID=UPI00374352EB